MTKPDHDSQSNTEPVDYDQLVDMFNRALVHTLRKHSVADSFLDFWVPDSDPILGIASMVDSARIAGLSSITLRVRRSTVQAHRVGELEQTLAATCTLSLKTRDDSLILRATNLRPADSPHEKRNPDQQQPSFWRPGCAAGLPDVGFPEAVWESTELAELSDIHPHFRSAVNVASKNLSCKGDLEVEPGSDLIIVSGNQGAVTLKLAVDPKTHVVQIARHAGAIKPSEETILDLFCRTSERLPIQEVADHVGLKVLEALVDHDKDFPVKGVLLPINAGKPFTLPARLARKAYDEYRALTGSEAETNFYHAPPSVAWQSLTAAQRLEKVDYVRQAFLQSEGLYPDDVILLEIGKNKYGDPVRVTIGFSDRVEVNAKPGLMRRLEQHLRRDLEPEIDLVAARSKDTSPLRRLS